jgi:hypothetical protein
MLRKETLRRSTRFPCRVQRTTCSATLLPALRKGLRSSGARAIWLISSMSRSSSVSGISK